jgi:hypothetical protein
MKPNPIGDKTRNQFIAVQQIQSEKFDCPKLQTEICRISSCNDKMRKHTPAVIEPPGELINNLISLVWSSASNSRSWLIMRSALVSSTYIA